MLEPVRSRRARQLAEAALGRIVVAYAATPDFVLLGGLVPDLPSAGALRRRRPSLALRATRRREPQGAHFWRQRCT